MKSRKKNYQRVNKTEFLDYDRRSLLCFDLSGLVHVCLRSTVQMIEIDMLTALRNHSRSVVGLHHTPGNKGEAKPRMLLQHSGSCHTVVKS